MKLQSREHSPLGLTPLVVVSGVAFFGALAAIFGYAPVERTMGIVQKIFYVHVPAAILSYVGIGWCCVASVAYLLTRDRKWDIWARASAEVGVLFGAFVLLSGPLWARKAWGTWWTGEPRLLLFLVLCLTFVAYLLVRSFGGQNELTRRICAVLAILGTADVPLVRMAVIRWRGTHPQVITGDGGGISAQMQVALLSGFAALGLIFALLLILRVRVGRAEADLDTIYRATSAREHRLDDLQAGMQGEPT